MGTTRHNTIGNKAVFTDQVGLPGGTGIDGTTFLYNSGMWIDFFQISTGKCVQFKAFLKSFQDSFSSRWNEEEVYGRNDPILTFQNTARKITFSWVTAASSIDEAALNLHHCEHLQAMLYPSYEDSDGASSLVASPLMKVKFSNWISNAENPDAKFAVDSGLVGSLSGLTMNPDLESGVFFHENGIYPKFINLETTLTVVHTHKLGWNGNKWRGDRKGKLMKFPYNVEEQTGRFSLCQKGMKGDDSTTPYVPASVQQVANTTMLAPATTRTGK